MLAVLHRLRVLFLGNIIVLGVLAALAPIIVILRAETAAGGRPYCIEIAGKGVAYRSAKTRLDLMPFQMRATLGRRGDYNTFHAVLFAERPEARRVTWGQPAFERFNWSYRYQRFMPIVGQGHAGLGDRPDCVPRPDFARYLPVLR